MATIYDQVKKEIDKILPEILDASKEVLDKLNEDLQSTIYANNNKKLKITWHKNTNSYAFKAYAKLDGNEPDTHFVVFYSQVPVEIYRDARIFTYYSTKIFTEKKFSTIYKSQDSKQQVGVLPKGMSKEEAKNKFFKFSLWWITFHEIGHLLQGHEKVKAPFSSKENTGTINNEIGSKEEELLGLESWVFHATEISADHEGIYLIIHYIVEKYHNISEADLWIIICSITCIFHRFYGKGIRSITPCAVGTHPNLAIRMDFLESTILIFFLIKVFINMHHGRKIVTK